MRRRSFASPRLRQHPRHRHLQGSRRRQGPLLLVLREQGGAVRRARAVACGPTSSGPGPRPSTPRPIRSTRLRQAVESSVRFIVLHTEFFTVVRMERREPTVSALLREAADADVGGRRPPRGRVPAGRADRRRPSSPAFLAQGVVGAVTTFCHAHRTGRLGMDVDELACAGRPLGGAGRRRRLRPALGRRRRAARPSAAPAADRAPPTEPSRPHQPAHRPDGDLGQVGEGREQQHRGRDRGRIAAGGHERRGDAGLHEPDAARRHRDVREQTADGVGGEHLRPPERVGRARAARAGRAAAARTGSRCRARSRR